MNAETTANTTTTPETVAAVIERKLMQLMAESGHDVGEEEAASEPESAAAPEQAPPIAELKPAETKEPPKAKAAGESEKADELPEDQELDKALNVLTLAGVPTDILTSASRETLLAWSADEVKRNAKREADLKKRAERIKELEGVTATTDAEQQPTPTAPVDLKDIAAKLTLTLNEARDVGPVIAELVAAIEARTKDNSGSTAETLKKVYSFVDEMGCAQAKRELEAQLPRLKDHEVFKRVRSDMDALAAAGHAKGMSPVEAYPFLMEKAYYANFGKEDAQEHQQSAADIRRKRANGQPTVPDLKGKPTPKNDYEKRVLFTEALMAGKSRDEARKLVYG